MLRVASIATAVAVLTFASPLSASAQSCATTTVRCVDDTAGANQEYSTIQAAVNAAQPGDTVLVFDGTYQAFQVTKSGTSAAPIVITAQANDATITSSGSSGDGILLSNVSYITLQGFRIQNSTRRCISGSNATPTSPMRGLTVRGNTCTNAGHEGIYISEVSNSLVEDNTVSNPGQDGLDRGHGMYLANAGSDNTIIRGNTFTGMNAPDSAGLHLNGDLSVGGDGLISGVVIYGNTIYNGRQNGISMDGVQNTTIQNNLIFGVSNNAVRGF